jgi:hypothetical protein
MSAPGYSMSNQGSAQGMTLGRLLGSSAWGAENIVAVGVPTKAKYNAHQNFKMASPGINKHDQDLHIMRKFLSNQDKKIMDQEGAQELVTVAEAVGRRGAVAKARTIIVNQLSNPATSPHFRVLPPKEMTEEEVAGVEQSVLMLGYTPMVEAPEFAPPHFLTFKTEIYRSASFRFNIGFRYQAEQLLASGGIQLVDLFAKRTVDNIIKFMEQMIMAALMGVKDAYVNAKLLYREAVSGLEELIDKIRYNGPLTGGSFLMSKKMVGILQKEDGIPYVMNWVKDVTLSNDARIDTLFHPPGIFRDIAYEFTDYSKEGPRANTAADTGARFVESLIRTAFGAINIVPNPTIRMQDARVEQEQMLANHMQTGHWYILNNEPHKRTAVIQSTRALDSSAHRFASGLNDLWFLNYSGSIIKERQSYEELVSAALCFDEDGNLNDRVYDELVGDVERVHKFARELEININDPMAFRPDPWLVRSGNSYRRVNVIGNQDVCYTSIEDTVFAVETAFNIIASMTSEKATTNLDGLMRIAEQNYNVKPDNDGEVEALWNAIAWTNVDKAKLDDNEAINYISKVRLPELIQTINPRGQVQRKCAYQRVDHSAGNAVSLFKVPIVDTDNGPLHDTPRLFNYDAIFNANAGIAAAHLGGYLTVGGNLVDIWGLLFLNTENLDAGTAAAARNIVRGYANNYGTLGGLNIAGAAADVQTLANAGVLTTTLHARHAGYPYAQPGNVDNEILVVDSSFLGFPFYEQGCSRYVDRITHGHLMHIYYRTLRAAFAGKNIQLLRQKAASHPAYEWIDSKLLNDPESNIGCVEGDRLVRDPTTLNYPGYDSMGIFKEAGLNHRSFFPVKMMALGFIQASRFYDFEQLSQCRFAGVEPGNVSFPGFSTIYSLQCIADQMKDGYHGWQHVGADKVIDKIKKSARGMTSFMNFAMDIFCPLRSSQTHQAIEPGLAFLHERFLNRHQRIKKAHDERANAILCFSNMITESSTRNFGMMQPFTNFPLHWSATAVSSDAYTDPYESGQNLESIHKRQDVQCSFRYTDVDVIANATPFMINKSLRTSIGRNPVTGTPGVAAVKRIASYEYMKNDADDREQKQTGTIEEFNFITARPIAERIAEETAKSRERGYVYGKFHRDIVSRLSKSDRFAFAKYIQNRSATNPSGVATSGGDWPDFELTGTAGNQNAQDFYNRYVALVDTVIETYDSDIYSDINNYRNALDVATNAANDYFGYMFESSSRIGNPNKYTPTTEQWDRWIEEAEERTKGMATDFASSASGDIGSNPAFANYMKDVRSRFVDTISQEEIATRGRKLYVTNMMLSIGTKYWTDVDKMFKSMYALPSDGMGVQFSMVRPQNKYTHDFTDVTFYPGTTLTLTAYQEKMRKYKELVAFGPGASQAFDFHTTLMKLSGGMDETDFLEDYGINEHFHRRLEAFKGDWRKRAIAIAYLTARPTAELMINLHRHGIPAPMSLVIFDPFMDFQMHSLLFCESGLGGGWMGHAFTLHTASFDSDTREIRHHLSTWLHPHTPYQNKVLYLPNAAFAGVFSGCSGKIVKTIEFFRPTCRERPTVATDENGHPILDWNVNIPRYRRADRFVCYGGGSLQEKELGEDINIVGSNITYGSNLCCGMDLPPGLIPPSEPNKMTYPSAIVANLVAKFFRLNKKANPKFINPQNMCDVRYNVPGDEDATFNVWVSRAPQFATNPKTGFGDVQISRGNSVVSHVGEGQGELLYGMPHMFTQRQMTADA